MHFISFLPTQHGSLPVDSGGLAERETLLASLTCPQNKVSDVEYQGQGRHNVSGAPPSEWVGATRVSTHRKVMRERENS